jgi:RimJ/RimL family protein N-acetyltransferase
MKQNSINQADAKSDLDALLLPQGIPFNQSEIWNELEQSQSELTTYQDSLFKSEVNSPNLALAYAQTIAHAWRQGVQQKVEKNNEPFYILELEASDGRFADLLLRELTAQLTAKEWHNFKPRYLLSDSREKRISNCWQHPRLRQWIEQGVIEPLQFDARTNCYVELKSRGLVLGKNSVSNPLFIIANGVFSSMRQSYYSIHYGRCFQALLNEEKQQLQASDDFEYQWQPVDNLTGQDALLPKYLERFDSAHVLLPQQMLTALKNVKEIANDDCFVLMTDRGFHSETDLREQSLPYMADCARYFLPINGHAVNWHAQAEGGQVINIQCAKDSSLHSIIHYPKDQLIGEPSKEKNTHELDQESVRTWFASCNDLTTRRMFELSHSANEVINLDQLYALLQLANFDHRILFTHLSCVFGALESINPQQRITWRDTLSKVWQRYYVFNEDADVLLDVALLAMRLGAWSTAKEVLTYIANDYPDHVEAHYYLSACQLHLGNLNLADRSIQQALQLAPNNEKLIGLKAHTAECRAICEVDACFNELLNQDNELSLQPLTGHYTEEFLYQYRDPTIAVMTSLPAFNSVDDFEEWRVKQIEKETKGIYAVVHKDLGFVGVVSLHRDQDSAFFYFWIGADYQGQGFGKRAAQLLFRMAAHTLGVQKFYTCAFEDNTRSISALTELGFEKLPFKAKEPDDDYAFFTTSREPLEGQYSSLSKLLAGIESPIELLDTDN